MQQMSVVWKKSTDTGNKEIVAQKFQVFCVEDGALLKTLLTGSQKIVKYVGDASMAWIYTFKRAEEDFFVLR